MVSARFRHRSPLVVLLVALSWALATASPATSPEAGARGRYRGQCRRLTKQIEYYEGTILPMAIERRNAGWERSTNEQVARLWHQRADLCPVYGAERTLMARAADQARRFNQFLASTGRAVATYFSGGALP
ncbi:MAG: hypothetical protein JRJ58_18700 [Deltaproteobacteria bacterium]|nr:hypothetical protein [Deltaproteobacteria bacterium]